MSTFKFLTNNVTTAEVQRAINYSNVGKSPGVDGIPYEIPKQFSNDTIKWLTKFYNFVIKEGIQGSYDRKI